MNAFNRILASVLAMLFSFLSTFGGLFPKKAGENLRVSAYLIARDAAAVENMDV